MCWLWKSFLWAAYISIGQYSSNQENILLCKKTGHQPIFSSSLIACHGRHQEGEDHCGDGGDPHRARQDLPRQSRQGAASRAQLSKLLAPMAIPCYEYVSSKIGTSGCNCEHPDNISVAIRRFVHFLWQLSFPENRKKKLFEEIHMCIEKDSCPKEAFQCFYSDCPKWHVQCSLLTPIFESFLLSKFWCRSGF